MRTKLGVKRNVEVSPGQKVKASIGSVTIVGTIRYLKNADVWAIVDSKGQKHDAHCFFDVELLTK